MLPLSSPTEVGLSVQRLGRINTIIGRHINDTKIAGATTLVARRGQVAHFDTHGLQDRETRRPMPHDAIFRIYSMTKPVTCAALMMLFEQGLVRLTDPVSNYIPAFRDLRVYVDGDRDNMRFAKLATPVTVQHLLTHTSGLTYHFSEYGPVEQLYRDHAVMQPRTLAGFVDAILQQPLAFQPGTRFRYSVAHDVVAYLVEVISGRPFEQFLQAEIFEPLGMVDTGFWVREGQHHRFASMYGSYAIDDPAITGLKMWLAAMRGKNELLAGPHDSRQSQSHTNIRGGSGLVSTTADYYRFCQMLLNNGVLDGERLLGRKTIELLTANQLAPDLLPWEIGNFPTPGYGFGLGMNVQTDVGMSQVMGSVGSYGWGGAANTTFWIDPAEQLIGIMMSQFQPSGFYPISADFRTAVYQAITD